MIHIHLFFPWLRCFIQQLYNNIYFPQSQIFIKIMDDIGLLVW